jgi:glycosyltransferase involved in cell wall biosynthesis
VFLYFGHAGKSKGIDYLIKALPDILKIDNIKFALNIIESKRTKLILKKLDIIKNKYDNKKNKLEIYN